MAETIWPAEFTNGGYVPPIDWVRLYSPMDDGVLPFEPANAFDVFIFGSNVVVNPGRFLIGGVVYETTAQIYKPVPPSSTGGTRLSRVVVFVDKTQTPWSYGIDVKLGVPGSGQPQTLSRSLTGRYEAEIKRIKTTSTGNQTFEPEPPKPVLRKIGGTDSNQMLYNPRFRIHKIGGATGLPPDQWSYIGPNTGTEITVLTGGEWTQAENQASLRTIPYRGYYEVYGQYRFGTFTPFGNHTLMAGIVQNGNIVTVAEVPRSLNRNATVQIRDTIFCNAGDTVTVQRRQESSAENIPTLSGQGSSFFEIRYRDLP